MRHGCFGWHMAAAQALMRKRYTKLSKFDGKVPQMDDLLGAAQLKKRRSSQKNQDDKEVGSISYAKESARQVNQPRQQKREQINKRKKDDAHLQVGGDNVSSNKGANMEFEEYSAIANFTQILTAPTCVDNNLLDQDIF